VWKTRVDGVLIANSAANGRFSDKTLSIVVPVHDPWDGFEKFFLDLFESIRIQSVKPTEIILGGSYQPAYLEKILNLHTNLGQIHFFSNKSSSTSANLNFLIRKSTSSLTKILFQDDFFIHENSIANIKKYFEKNDVTWLATASKNYCNSTEKFVKNIRPRMSRNLADGINSIGSPSVITLKTSHFVDFDEDLIWMLDCDWYLRMAHQQGLMGVLKDFQIANRLHPRQATHSAKRYQIIEAKKVKDNHRRLDPYIPLISNETNHKCSCQN
jgi:hypothetical protein